jgi:UDP-N-acetyl-D-mannosaminuronic acid dehydrogenase
MDGDDGASMRMVVVGGCGHVGLPFGISFALAGLDVALLDIDSHTREKVAVGVMPFEELGGEEALHDALARKKLSVSGDPWIVKDAAHIVITIGTPVDGYGNPRMGPLLDLMGDLLPHLRHGQHVMLRSTVFPGTTTRLRRLLDGANLHGVDLTFCPERIVQGRALKELRELPQIVAGTSREATSRAAWLFSSFMGVETVGVGLLEAELAKLFCNSWRYIRFAAANQFYEMATSIGASWPDVMSAMTTRYERMRDFPSPGFAAGPCLLKDTQQLAAAFEGRFSMGAAARQVNEGMPDLIAKQVDAAMADLFGDDVGKRCVGILGMAFKANIDDTRDSLSFKLKKLLEWRGYHVIFSDEHAQVTGAVPKKTILLDSDVVVIAVPHHAYGGISSTGKQKVVNPWE